MLSNVVMFAPNPRAYATNACAPANQVDDILISVNGMDMRNISGVDLATALDHQLADGTCTLAFLRQVCARQTSPRSGVETRQWQTASAKSILSLHICLVSSFLSLRLQYPCGYVRLLACDSSLNSTSLMTIIRRALLHGTV